MSTQTEKRNKAVSTVVANLRILLANSYVLYTKTLNFHWNVTGPRFYILHKLFEDQYKELAEGVDIVAEQIRILHEWTPGSMSEFLDLTTLSECQESISENDMLLELQNDHEIISHQLAEWIEEAQAASDEGTADLMIQRLRAHDKARWMLRSHLKG